MKSHGLVGSRTCPIGWMDDLYELAKEVDKVLLFDSAHAISNRTPLFVCQYIEKRAPLLNIEQR
ncbi:putative DsrE family protein [Desulfosarcina variabilis str. Montpellier]